MRRHFASIPAAVSLSVEEAAILDDELGEYATLMSDGVEDIGRLGDIVVCVADVQTVVSNTPYLSTVESDLIAAVGEMAVAGTDANSDDIVPTTLEDETLSAEGFVDTVKGFLARMWEAIKSALAKMWEHIKNFFGKLKLSVDRSIKKAEHVQQTSKEAAKEPAASKTNTHFIYHGQIENLMLGGKVSPDIGNQLMELLKSVDRVASKTMKTLKDTVDAIDHAVSTLTAGDGRHTFPMFAEVFLDLVDEVGRNIGKKDDKGSYGSPMYLGEFSLALEVPPQFSDKNAPIRERYLHACAAKMLTVVHSEDLSLTSMEVPILPHAVSGTLATESLKWLEALKANGMYSEVADLEDQVSSVTEKIDALTAKFQQDTAQGTPPGIESVNFLTDLMRALPFVSKIKTKVAADFLLRALKVNNEVLVYANQSNKIHAGNDPT